MTGRPGPGQGTLFEMEECLPRPAAPGWPPEWAGFPEGPARDGEGRWTGPCLYASPARGLAARTAEYELWRELFGSGGCAVDSHAWYCPAWYQAGPLPRHEAALLEADLRRFRRTDRYPVPPCGHDEDWLLYRSACRKEGCGWEGPVRGRENDAVEDGMDHAWPGWRDLPAVPRAPDLGGNPNPYGKARKTLDAWTAKVAAVYPAGWVESGGPIRTVRDRPASRHVEAATPWGGYDLSIGTQAAKDLAARLAPQGSLL